MAAIAAAAAFICDPDAKRSLRDYLLPAIIHRLEYELTMDALSSEDRECEDQILILLLGFVAVLLKRVKKHDALPHAGRVMKIVSQAVQFSKGKSREEAISSLVVIATQLTHPSIFDSR